MFFIIKDMDTASKTKAVGRYVFLDVAVVTAACLIPTLSHVTALPLYMLNPMLALLLVGMLLGGRKSEVGGRWNALALAVLMPAVSCLVVGMPTAPKMVCMMAELATVAGLYYAIVSCEIRFLNKRIGVLPAILMAVLAGKVAYYALKAVIIAPAVLIGTAWWMQLGAVVLWGGLFAMLKVKSER